MGQVLKVSGTLLNIREPRKRSTGWDNDGKNERSRDSGRTRGEVSWQRLGPVTASSIMSFGFQVRDREMIVQAAGGHP